MFHNVKEAINWIESVKKFGDKLDLSRITLACEILGNPQNDLNVIHIAGTNGKGSTVSYIRHALLENGYNVGTFTSPYIVNFNERITNNRNDISDDDLFKYINQVKELHDNVLKDHNEVITFFELVTLISFLYFKDLQLDFCIYEVGLGGTLDATNVVKPIITAITSISYDHMGVLGNTLEEIALNKLGIVKQGIPLITTVKDKELFTLFQDYTKEKQSDITIIDQKDIEDIAYSSYTNFKYKENTYEISMLGTHQVSNAVLSLEILDNLERNNHVSLDYKLTYNGLKKTFWPGRLERIGDNILLDGAHNIGAMNVLKDSVNTLFKDKTVKVLYTSMADKSYNEIIKILETFSDVIYFTEFDYPRCETAQNLFDVSNHIEKHILLDPIHNLESILPKSNEVLLITGSLYFISYIRKALI